MILDNQTLFSDNQAITADAASTNIIDLGATGTPYGDTVALSRDIGKGTNVPVLLTVTEGFNTLTSLIVSIQTDSVENFASPTTIGSRTYALAELTLGSRLEFPASLPEGTDERYVRLYYDVVGTNPTLGKLTAGVVAGRQTNG